MRIAAIRAASVMALALAAVSGSAAASTGALLRVTIEAAVASAGGRVMERAALEAMVARANRVFAPARLSFELAALRPLDGAHAHLETRRDRHALAAKVRPGVINLFVVASLRDVDEPNRMRQGVHWRPDRARPRLHYVIVSSAASEYVLAHELGHYFGNHRHAETPGNVMSYIRLGEPFFDETQLRVIERHSRRFLRTGELVARGSDGSLRSRVERSPR